MSEKYYVKILLKILLLIQGTEARCGTEERVKVSSLPLHMQAL